jgi:ribosomal protein S8E
MYLMQVVQKTDVGMDCTIQEVVVHPNVFVTEELYLKRRLISKGAMISIDASGILTTETHGHILIRNSLLLMVTKL